MTHLHATNVAFQYPQHAEPLFKDITVSFSSNTRAGLVGQNGAGKSTFCALLVGTLSPSSGRIIRNHVGAVEFYAVSAIQHAKDLFSYFSEQNVDIYSSDFIAAIATWGIEYDQLFQPLLTWSGGQKARALLAALFIKRPSFMILDEPTNHLDHEGIALLERHLENAGCGYLIISHNRDFLDRTTSSTLWLEDQALTSYGVSISACLKQREALIQKAVDRKSELLKGSSRLRQMQREKQQIGDSMDKFKPARSIRKNGGVCQYDVGSGSSRVNTGKSMRQARTLGDKADALLTEAQELSIKKDKVRKLSFSEEPAARQVLISWDRKDIKPPGTEQIVLSQLSLSLGSTQRVAFLGPNGCGKTLVLGEIHKELRSKGVTVGLMQQELPDTATGVVADYLGEGDRELLEKALNALGSLHVSGDLRTRNIDSLSAGEKAKVVLAKLFALAPSVLILDEVTNHVSMIDLMAIEQALNAFRGTLIVVSHDEAFVRNLRCSLLDLQEFRAKP